MENYFPYQRYTSKGEPELGVGIVTETNKGKVQLYFPTSDTTRLYAIASAPLQRVIFKPGDTIKDKQGQSFVVKQATQEQNLYVYTGTGWQLSEAELGDVTATHSAEDRLFTGDVDSPQAFALRRATLQHDYNRRLSTVNGFVGGRIDLIPHQLYIAHEVSSRYAPRVLLSDQVGLGKTIEACLIIHRLLLSERISRVLILVPESLVHQWFVEVWRRFNLWFNIFDEERCEALDEGAPDNNPFLANQLVICSTEFLAGSAKRTQQALAAGWDMLVVDEAHNLEWSVDKVSPAYGVVELLSKVAEGLLLLTATPEQLGVVSHFARLRLLDPSRYADLEGFIKETSNHKKIANIVEKLDCGKSLTDGDINLLTNIFSKDRIQLVVNGDQQTKNKLIEDLLDQHGPGRVLFRNTRATISGFPKRKAHLEPLTTAKDENLWLERLRNEFLFEINPEKTNEEQEFFFSKDPRVLWLQTTLKQLQPAKILLICNSKEKVLALEDALTKRININVGVFHEDLTIVQRDKNAAWFADENGAQILLCSEIGSEGRNFQFAHHLILFDLPLHPDLLEQRIGRLDRIGQTTNIQIHIPYFINSPQHVLAKWYNEGLNAFEKNLEGGNKIFNLFNSRLLEITQSNKPVNDNKELTSLIAETKQFQKELQKSLANGRDKLLEMNSFRPKLAQKLVAAIQKQDQDTSLEQYFTSVFKHFDVEMEDLAPRTYFLHPASAATEVFPSIPRAGIGVTFDRKRALSREEMSFLSWDHPITTSAMDMVLSSETGSASFGLLRGSNNPGLLLELLFVLETPNIQHIHTDRFLPNTPIRVVVDHTGEEVTDEYPTELLSKKLISGKIDPLLDNDMLVETMLPNMIDVATDIATEQGVLAMQKGLKQMNLVLNHEINRLQQLQLKNKNVRPVEIVKAQKEQQALAAIIQHARVRMDAIMLIRKE